MLSSLLSYIVPGSAGSEPASSPLASSPIVVGCDTPAVTAPPMPEQTATLYTSPVQKDELVSTPYGVGRLLAQQGPTAVVELRWGARAYIPATSLAPLCVVHCPPLGYACLNPSTRRFEKRREWGLALIDPSAPCVTGVSHFTSSHSRVRVRTPLGPGVLTGSVRGDGTLQVKLPFGATLYTRVEHVSIVDAEAEQDEEEEEAYRQARRAEERKQPESDVKQQTKQNKPTKQQQNQSCQTSSSSPALYQAKPQPVASTTVPAAASTPAAASPPSNAQPNAKAQAQPAASASKLPPAVKSEPKPAESKPSAAKAEAKQAEVKAEAKKPEVKTEAKKPEAKVEAKSAAKVEKAPSIAAADSTSCSSDESSGSDSRDNSPARSAAAGMATAAAAAAAPQKFSRVMPKKGKKGKSK